MHTMTSSVEAILKSFCIVNIPDHVIACSGILDKLKEYFGKEENGGGEILKCSVQGRSTILVTLSIGVDGQHLYIHAYMHPVVRFQWNVVCFLLC